MIPAIESYYFYLYRDFRDGDNPLNLLQLIAHAENFVENKSISAAELKEIQKNKKLCELFFEDAWSSRNGVINFFTEEFSDQAKAIFYYEELLNVASEYDFLKPILPKIENVLRMVREDYHSIKNLSGEEKSKLRMEMIKEDYTTRTLRLIADNFIENSSKYCRDEKGDTIDIFFSGKLEKLSNKGILSIEYTLKEGLIDGECTYYYHDGTKKEIAICDGYTKKESLTRWFPDGQIQYEKTNDHLRYWHKNGQMSMEKIDGEITRWDENGEEKD